MRLCSVRAAPVRGKRALLRLELNVARNARDYRLQCVKPTLTFLIQKGARIIIATHLGRPHGRFVSKLSTRKLVHPLSKLLQKPVRFIDSVLGSRVEKATHALKAGQVLLLENLRFHKGEERNDPAFARSLSRLADLFVLEAFGTAHRRHASIVGVGKYLPSYAGFRMIEEVHTLSKVLAGPQRPQVIILGGAKISTKIGLVRNLLQSADALLLGGALANTILKAQGIQIGASYIEPKTEKLVKSLPLTHPKLHIPIDVVVKEPKRPSLVRAVGGVKARESILDIGPDTIELFRRIIHTAKTLIWNGPVGKYETPPFDRGTRELAKVVAKSPAFTVVGGGETVDAFQTQGLLQRIDFVSTGGGAMIEFLHGRTLPGIKLVQEKP